MKTDKQIEKTKQLLNDALNLIETYDPDKPRMYMKTIMDTEEKLSIANLYAYYSVLESIFETSKIINQRFSKETAYKILEKYIFSKKISGKEFSDEDALILMKDFADRPPKTVKVFAPISGIRLDKNKTLILGPFEIGNSSQLKNPISNEETYYICSELKNIYDNQKAISTANEEFQEFIKIIAFMHGRKDGSIFIKTGLPSYRSISHELMYIDTSSYQLQAESLEETGSSIKNKFVEKIPLDNDFFEKNPKFSQIWEIYRKRKNNAKSITDFQGRILNCSLSIGEAVKNNSEKDSILYTCIALEMLLSYDDGSLFQKSIADRLADTFAFIVGNDKESRLKIIRLLKKVYGMRSALVHGGKKTIDPSYMEIIQLTRLAISELLSDEKYDKITRIHELYDMVRDAQNSY